MTYRRSFRVPFLDLAVRDQAERADILSAVGRVLDHGRIIFGPEVGELERSFEKLTGRQHAVGCGSGTDALYLAFRALGIGQGDEVITPALIWLATANAIANVGATPVFADIDNAFNIDPASVARLVTPRTKAVLAVHAMGKICDISRLQELAKNKGLLLIEDASQAFGASYEGRTAGSFGDVSCLSLNPMKLFGACGEAGMTLTNDKSVADHILRLRHHGMVDKEHSLEPAFNMRLDTLQAAILLARLPRLEGTINRRRELAKRYSAALSGLVETPKESESGRDVYFVYTIRTPERDRLEAHLLADGVEARVRDRVLVPHQAHFSRPAAEPWPNAERLASLMISLPMHEHMSDNEQDIVINSVRQYFSAKGVN